MEKSDSDAKQSTDGQLLNSIDAVYAQHQAKLEQQSRLEVQAKNADEQLAVLDKYDPDEPKPYSFLLLEHLKDELTAETDRQSALAGDLKSAKQMLETAHDELDASKGLGDMQQKTSKSAGGLPGAINVAGFVGRRAGQGEGRAARE